MNGKKGDLLAVALVLAAAIGLGVWVTARAADSGAPVAVIYQDGAEVCRIDLNAVTQAQTFTISGAYRNEIAVENGRIRVLASDCPGADCVRSGWAARTGKAIVCLPNRLEIRLEGGEADVDVVAR